MHVTKLSQLLATNQNHSIRCSNPILVTTTYTREM